MSLYKLTKQDHTTYGGMKWGPGVSHRATGDKAGGLCTSGYIHAYTDPNLAVLLNPIHGNFSNPVLWEGEGKIYETDGLKVGCRQFTAVKEIKLPKFTTDQRIAFAIFCAQEVYDDEEYKKWAVDWLSGKDRSAEAARAAGDAAEDAAGAAGDAAEDAAGAAGAAAGAASAAWDAAGAARAAWDAAWAARAAWDAAWAAWAAAGAAAGAAAWAAAGAAAGEIDLAALAQKALDFKP